MGEDSDILKKIRFYGRKTVEVGADMAEVLVQMRQVTPLTALSVGAKLLSTIDKARSRSPDELIRGWTRVPDLAVLNEFCFSIAKSQSLLQPEGKDENSQLFMGHIHGVHVAWRNHAGWVEGPWVENPSANLLANLGRLIWETLGSHIKYVHPFPRPASLQPDILNNTLSSRKGQEIYEELIRPFRDRHRGRSVLFVGESGVGKSHLMRYIAQLAGGFSLRVSAKSLSQMSSVHEIFSLLHPSAVILDDLDRNETPGAILEQLEEIKAQDTLFLVSVNNVHKLDHAALRPGRFDEYIRLDKIDDEIVDMKIGEVPEDVAAVLRSMPIAYVDAYHDDVQVLGPEQALARIKKLKERHDLVSSMAATEAAKETKTTKAH